MKTSLGEVALFLGVRPRFTVLDAIENLHRLDKDFLKELVAKHKSGLDILAGSEQFDRPNAQDASAIEELLRVLTRDLRLRRHRRRQHDHGVRRVGALRGRHDLPGHESRRAVDPQRAAPGGSRASARRRQRAREDAAEPRRRTSTSLRPSRSRPRWATASTTRSRATTGRCRPRSTRACRCR